MGINQPNLWDNGWEVLSSQNIMLISSQEGHFLPGKGPKFALLPLSEQKMSIVQSLVGKREAFSGGFLAGNDYNILAQKHFPPIVP